MDNAAPGLNFAAGNLVGINEIDIQSVELLPGAASALYGANAIKGILLMNSKSPFDFPGFSAYIKSGVCFCRHLVRLDITTRSRYQRKC